MQRRINETYEQTINKKLFRAPIELVKQIYEAGAFISSGSYGKYMYVNRYNRKTKKVEYMGTLQSYVKQNSRFRDGDPRNVVRSNLVSM